MIDIVLIVIIMATTNSHLCRFMLVLLTRLSVQNEQTSCAKHLSPKCIYKSLVLRVSVSDDRRGSCDLACMCYVSTGSTEVQSLAAV